MGEHATDFDSIARHCMAIVARTRQIPVEAVTLDSSLEALEVDSLDKVSLSFDLEDAYNIDIPDSALFQVKTVGDIVRGVHVALTKRDAAASHTTSTVESGSEKTVAAEDDATPMS